MSGLPRSKDRHRPQVLRLTLLISAVAAAGIGISCSDDGTKLSDTSGARTPSPGATPSQASPAPDASTSSSAPIISLPPGFTLRDLPAERQPFLDQLAERVYSDPQSEEELTSISAQQVYFEGRELGVVVVTELTPGIRVNRDRMLKQLATTAEISPEREEIKGEVVHHIQDQVHYYLLVDREKSMTMVISPTRKDARAITRAVIGGAN